MDQIIIVPTVPQTVHLHGVRTLIIFCAELPVRQIIKRLLKTLFVWLLFFACPLWICLPFCLLLTFIFMYHNNNFCLLPATFAHLLFGFHFFYCFSTSRLPSISVLYLSDYLVTESWNIKENVFCIIPGLHLVPYPSITILFSSKSNRKHWEHSCPQMCLFLFRIE